MELRFWGVRGSIAAPGPATVKVGGNTTCLSVRDRDYLSVFDAGTGIRRLGEYLEDEALTGWRGSIFLTHYHWDHIQGLPFFAPSRRRENRFELYGEAKDGVDPAQILRRQMQGPYFPLDLDDAKGLAAFNTIGPGQRLHPRPGWELRTVRLQHPGGAIGYRLETPHGSLVVVLDHEHPAAGLDAAVIDFARGCDVLVHDAQYTPREKRGSHAGWGHSSWEEAARTARAAGVGRLFLCHHDPGRCDRDVLRILAAARCIFPATDAATESTVWDLARAARPALARAR